MLEVFKQLHEPLEVFSHLRKGESIPQVDGQKTPPTSPTRKAKAVPPPSPQKPPLGSSTHINSPKAEPLPLSVPATNPVPPEFMTPPTIKHTPINSLLAAENNENTEQSLDVEGTPVLQDYSLLHRAILDLFMAKEQKDYIRANQMLHHIRVMLTLPETNPILAAHTPQGLFTPLQYAVALGLNEVLSEMLMIYPHEMHLTTDMGLNLLQTAAANGHLECTRILIQVYRHTKTPYNLPHQHTPLYLAIINQHTTLAVMLMQLGRSRLSTKDLKDDQQIPFKAKTLGLNYEAIEPRTYTQRLYTPRQSSMMPVAGLPFIAPVMQTAPRYNPPHRRNNSNWY